MSAAEDVLKRIKDDDIQFVDLRFTDTKGKWQHLTFDHSQVDEGFFEDGSMFDGSSIAGWKPINESDMVLMPEAETAVIDPFFAARTLSITCDVLEPSDMSAFNRCPRSTAKAAEAYMQKSGIGDSAFFGPEAEFFVFDDVLISTSQDNIGFSIDSGEGPYNMDTPMEGGNLGHRPRAKGGYFPVPPVDSEQDMRSEMIAYMREMGLTPEKHHHEVAPSQHELGIKFSTLTDIADQLQIYKYVVQQVADSFGKTATFMPKPIHNDNGSGMHVHQSIWKDGDTIFSGEGYTGLNDTCLYYIGGIIKHARAINAFANSTTNSYKRLVPGYEAPVILAYSSRNRSASVRIPWVTSPKAKRIETRFPDAAGNPYLTFTALLMAGLDGIENQIHPGEPMEEDLYALSDDQLKDIPSVSSSLDEALDALDKDRAFLTKAGVMDNDQIDGYIALKQEEVARYNQTPHPVEFDMYYSS
ncbi:MAG: type I glutamate--ammonia ligase [Pseudomonadota bacterium]